MNARFALIAGAATAAGALAARLVLSRRRRPPPDVSDPADELRRKLDEARSLASEREEFEAGETTVDQATSVPETVDERRRRLHEQARAAVDEMRLDSDSS
jgi:hypothetical protein